MIGRGRRRFLQRRSTRVALRGMLTAVCLASLGAVLMLGTRDDLETVYAAGTLAVTDSLTPELVALGDSVFHGQVASGACSICHGQKGIGSLRGPSLRNGEWLHGDGSMDSILSVVRRGVMLPRHYRSAMPSFAGTMDDEYLVAVAAYVYSLSHRVPAAK